MSLAHALTLHREQGKEDQARAKLYGRVGKQIVAACVPWRGRSGRSVGAAWPQPSG
jgi:hypothetical protein